MAGDPNAPVVMSVYACGRSAPCAKLIPALYSSVATGILKGKVRLIVRPFYLEKQEEAAQCGRTLVATASQNMLWAYLLYLYNNQDNFKLCLLGKWADLKGLADYPCKSAGVIEYTGFAKAIDPRIWTRCIGCPPDAHPDEWRCAWEFTIEEA